jgi:SpoVK/Ycf46/Vps4 family AAA+-type ATPase
LDSHFSPYRNSIFSQYFSAEDLDSAILDRCDESMLFPLPNYDSRKAQVLHYFDLYVKSMERMVKWENKLMLRLNEMMYGKDTFSVTIENEAMDEKQVEDITKATEGFSGREIAKLMIAIQGNVYASTDGKLTREMITDIVNLKVNDHEMKIRMGINTSQKNKTRHFQSINEFDDKSSGELDTATDSSPTSISPSCSYELSECDLVLEETVHTTGNDQHHQADEANKRGCICVTS